MFQCKGIVHGHLHSDACCGDQINPYEPEVDWFTRDREIHPILNAPEPKRRFTPSKWEEQK